MSELRNEILKSLEDGFKESEEMDRYLWLHGCAPENKLITKEGELILRNQVTIMQTLKYLVNKLTLPDGG